MKYVMLEIRLPELTRKVPIIFPDELVHSLVVDCIKKHPGMETAEVVSAGQFSSMEINGNNTFHGGSETCGVDADPEDGRTVQLYDYLHGLV